MSEEKIGVRLRKNPLKSKEAAPYLATVVPNGTVGLDAIVSEVAETMHTTVATTRMYWDAMMEVVKDELAKGHKVCTPFGLFEPAIGGSMDTEDAPFDPARNEVYVRVTPTAAMRQALDKLKPVRLDAPTSDLAISAVVTPALGRLGYNAIRPGEPFTVSGCGLCTDAAATLTDAKGVEHALAVDLAKGLSMICRAEGTLAKGTGCLTVSVSGGDRGDVLFTASRKVKIL